MQIHLSIITPTYNEEESIQNCISNLRSVMKNQCPNLIYEHVIIDNCSSDSTVERVSLEAKSDSRIKLIVNSRNIGASKSIYRALGRVTGNWVVPMLPADLQDPAEVIPAMLELADSEVEIVYGVRSNRQEPLIMRTLRRIYYRTLRRFSNIDLQNDAGEFVLISSRVVRAILDVKDQNPYIRGLIAQTGAKYSKVSYTWGRRKAGRSKSSPFVLADVAISGLVSTSQIPARIALLSGFAISLIGMLVGLTYLMLSLFTTSQTVSGIPTLIIALFFLSGIQIFFTGLVGEYVLSIHRQVKPEATVYSASELNF
jgi:glycosyltransferase involved in cell wall biosynthesis